MRAFAIQGSNASGSATKTLLSLLASTSVRPRVFEFSIGCSASPSDTGVKLALRRFTTAQGTSGSTPNIETLDSADLTAASGVGAGHSAEPTYTSGNNLHAVSMNSRATFRYIAKQGYEFVAPASNNSGIGLQLVASSAAIVMDGDLKWME